MFMYFCLFVDARLIIVIYFLMRLLISNITNHGVPSSSWSDCFKDMVSVTQRWTEVVDSW